MWTGSCRAGRDRSLGADTGPRTREVPYGHAHLSKTVGATLATHQTTDDNRVEIATYHDDPG